MQFVGQVNAGAQVMGSMSDHALVNSPRSVDYNSSFNFSTPGLVDSHPTTSPSSRYPPSDTSPQKFVGN